MKFNNFLNILFENILMLKIEFCYFEHNLLNDTSLRFFDVALIDRRWQFRANVNLRLILSQCFFIKTLWAFSCNFVRVSVCKKIKENSIDFTCVSTIKSWREIVLKMLQIMRKFCFCNFIKLFVNLFKMFDWSCKICQVMKS